MVVMDDVTARTIPAGARVDRSYWALPTAYSIGDEFSTEEQALSVGIDRMRAAVAGHQGGGVPLPERFEVDLRWTLSWARSADAPAGGMDIVVSRRTYESVAEAEQHLSLIRRHAGAEQRTYESFADLSLIRRHAGAERR